MCYDAHGHEFLAVVAAVHHQGVCEALDDGALRFSEAFDRIATCGVGDVDWGADLDVIAVFRINKSAFLLLFCSVPRIKFAMLRQ